ncbi:hypothetical protein LTR53_003673 [Teratosphaeriaceae sp. CCFEE 6253]|nr:hypothetical protein LTR53_003673 [Teratosphaeriaceae sp. CCFEE 6253]
MTRRVECRYMECSLDILVVRYDHHLRDVHGDDSGMWACHYCEDVFQLEHDMTRHEAQHVKLIKCYEDDMCGKVFCDNKTLQRHIRNVHQHADEQQCTKCPKKLATISMRAHMLLHKQKDTADGVWAGASHQTGLRVKTPRGLPPQFIDLTVVRQLPRECFPNDRICRVVVAGGSRCGTYSATRDEFMDHVHTIHQAPPLFCTDCGTMSPDQARFEVHITEHLECGHCGKVVPHWSGGRSRVTAFADHEKACEAGEDMPTCLVPGCIRLLHIRNYGENAHRSTTYVKTLESHLKHHQRCPACLMVPHCEAGTRQRWQWRRTSLSGTTLMKCL